MSQILPATEQMQSAAAPNTARKPRTKRILELDALRAISCLNLLLFHFTFVYQNKYGFASPLGFAFPYGKYGVQLFFMLSGLVNAMTMLAKRKPGDFIAARCIRIFPSYWLMIVLNLALFACLPMYGMAPSAAESVANASTLPRLFGFNNFEPVTWTLQVEMLFYGFLMMTLVLGWIDRPLRLMMTCVAVCLSSCLFFDWHFVQYPDSVWNQRFTTIEQLFFMRNLPLFAMGILLNEMRSKRGVAWKHAAGILVSALAFHAIDLRDHNPVATALLFGLLAASAFGKVPVLRFRPLLFISTISYTLYLFHNNAGCALMAWLESLGLSPMLTLIAATAFAIAIGAATTFLFEQPVTKFLRGRWQALKARRNPAPVVDTSSVKAAVAMATSRK
jgi:peptidoglycan/LPS O-acetylase OafA/YrhL